MAEYVITFARSARKELESLDRRPSVGHLTSAAGLPKAPGRGRPVRIRVGDYRVVYAVDDENRRVDVTAIRHRRDAYR